MKTLKDIKPGQKCKVLSITGCEDIKQKLYDLGIIPGVKVEVIQDAPFGGPIKLKIHDYCLALRKKEAFCIVVEEER
ncbi:MAG: ferrous iron transport protein A [Sulfurihydrogenibium azorense]|uniref:FeoA family protein n=1 Tax=Sulfurihydrogenibium azorense TaxID=309806 RepID=UPI002409497C|nr:ferrous iron transport protein A [Sulfurihydrogenibium azorense]MDM7273812.1 ferrous iron transport protein A [Sulfurihydrogenibium azorense]